MKTVNQKAELVMIIQIQLKIELKIFKENFQVANKKGRPHQNNLNLNCYQGLKLELLLFNNHLKLGQVLLCLLEAFYPLKARGLIQLGQLLYQLREMYQQLGIIIHLSNLLILDIENKVLNLLKNLNTVKVQK